MVRPLLVALASCLFLACSSTPETTDGGTHDAEIKLADAGATDATEVADAGVLDARPLTDATAGDATAGDAGAPSGYAHVQCRGAADCPGQGICNVDAPGGQCNGCGSDDDCPAGYTCGELGACTEGCSSDDDCGAARRCLSGSCRFASCASTPCPEPYVCVGRLCQRPSCGAGGECPAPFTCRAGTCVEP